MRDWKDMKHDFDVSACLRNRIIDFLVSVSCEVQVFRKLLPFIGLIRWNGNKTVSKIQEKFFDSRVVRQILSSQKFVQNFFIKPPCILV